VVEVDCAQDSSATIEGAVACVADEWLVPASAQVVPPAVDDAFHEAKPETADERARRRRVTGLVFLTVFIDFLGLGVLLPVTPFLVARFEDGALAVGVLSAAFALSQFVATPVLGAMSDRLGRRPVLIFSLIGSAIGYGVLGLAGALWVMIVARVVDGVTGANVSTAQAALADITPSAKRSRAFALIGVAVGLGFVMGPALGGVLAERVSLTSPVFVAGGLSLLAGVFAWFALPETLTSARRRRGALTSREVNPLAHIGSAWRVPSVRWAVLALLCAGVPFAALSSNLGVYVGRVFSMGPKDAAMLLTWMGVVMMVMQGVVVRRLSGRIDDRVLATAGLVLFGVGLLVIAFVPPPGWWGLYVGIGLFAAGHGLCSPTLTGVVSRAVDERAQGSVLGVATGLLSLTRVVGPLLAGVLFDHLSPGSVYWSGAVWVVVALVMAGMGMRGNVAKY
jgi:MFS family permease